jgi:bifunctional enzyme CysN/CysC
MSAVLKPVPPPQPPEPSLNDTPQLRVLTCGSVDDGKSTLLGRLLFDSQAVMDDQLVALDQESRRWGTQGDNRDFALLLDGLGAEREQGITIDVAYRYFSTARRSFIIADTPGHEQYTRNMATGASTADLAIILIDARRGVLAQTRRHAFIVAALGIRHAVLAINKMDLVGFSQVTWQQIVDEFAAAARPLGFRSIVPIPVCARDGDNVVDRSARMPWFDGGPLLEYLETVVVSRPETEQGFAMPVQLVLRPNSEFRGYAGTVTSGVVREGQAVVALPSGQSAHVARIVTADGDRDSAESGRAVTITLDREIDVARGDVLAAADDAPTASASVEAELIWMATDPLVAGREFTVRLGTASAHARIVSIRHAIDIQTYAYRKPASLKLNEIGLVELAFDKPLVTRPYALDRTLGAMILVDRLTHQTVGMATVQALISPPRWRPSRRLAIYVVDGVVIGAIAGALSSSLAFAALVGVAEMLVRPLLDYLLEAAEQ